MNQTSSRAQAHTILAALFLLMSTTALHAQSAGWQQHAEYTMDIDMDADAHRYDGKQTLVLTNNSPDTLYQVFYHLYFNAFAPGSQMDVRSRSIKDPDGRVKDRISKLSADEIGFIRPSLLTQDGTAVDYEVAETILEVQLAQPILPGAKSEFKMEWLAQVPLQIRRSGRDNAEGVEFSMSQWYPKMCEYDARGWHANPYIGREFYGIWGNFDVTIRIAPEYVVGGSGYLQNPQEVGHGYAMLDKKALRANKKKKKLVWRFVAPNVHDFMWAADPDYIHDIRTTKSGIDLHFLYQDDDEIKENWVKFQPDVERLFEIASERYGKYPYKQYSVIQGGDGGMEYPMGTLITGKRKYGSLLGVTVHEAMHSWYQMLLATNEAVYPWMDEGFTSYASSEIMAEFNPPEDPRLIHNGAFRGYQYIAQSGNEEPLCTHADHYSLNQAYGIASYNKGEVFLTQLSYIIGKENLDRTLLRYFDEWAYRHPDMWDFIRIAEKQSGLELDWYLEYYVNSTKTVDYAVTGVIPDGEKTIVELKRVGEMIMPVDVHVMGNDGKASLHTIPLGLMRGAKEEAFDGEYKVEKDWMWTDSVYTLTLDIPMADIASVEIDQSMRLADMDRENNRMIYNEEEEEMPVKEAPANKEKMRQLNKKQAK